MVCRRESCLERALRRADAPARNSAGYRVQFRDAETNSWRVYANFQFLGEAEACLNELLYRGIEARLDTQRGRRITA